MTNVKSPHESHKICNLLLIIISMLDLMILPQLSNLLNVMSLILFVCQDSKYIERINFFFFFISKLLCFPSEFVVFMQGSRRGTLTHSVINMCTSMSAFHRRFPCLLLQDFSPSRMYFYGSVQSSAWTTYGKKSVILAKNLPQGNVN